MSVLAAIAVIALLIFVHESGHFLAARFQGIHVNRFSIGFGPILWKYQGPETEYALRAIPLGGFVGFPDDDPESDIPPQDPDLLKNRPVLDRAIVISAGVIANLLFAYLVFVAQFASVGVPQAFNPEPGILIPQIISESSPAAEAGIRPGDVILSADSLDFNAEENTVQDLVDLIQNNPERPIDLMVQRNDELLDLTVTPELAPNGKSVIGVQLQRNGELQYRRANTVFEIFGLAAQEFQGMFIQTVQGFAALITNFSQMASQVAGPVRIVEQGADLASSNAATLFPFTAIISINLAIINILPLPALDGGQLAFLLIEALRGRPLPERLQENVMQTGLVLLLGLGVFLIVRDTSQLEIFQDLLQ
ncbi:RIP metalloprotease RseP [Oscillatoria sp. CS-180]|uniref:RIP metalloprotease RseP n=1 Tax=Oscillatoria sp. CS-180 TaxID=3021720 RepID=UPI0023302D79|nr:RIP metalloprotease RseP [Oscillatoria sp. CS-180]MDB9527451.1 RIP metalloprotease RseP [Oscillatoria sp. CS-180]